MSGSRNENLEQLENYLKAAFDREGERNNSAALAVLNHLDTYCSKLKQDASLVNKMEIIDKMKIEITTISESNPSLFKGVMDGLKRLNMGYALAQVAERKAVEKSQHDADKQARQSRISRLTPQEQESVFSKIISAELAGFSANKMTQLQTLCKELMGAKSPADKHKIIAEIRGELTPGRKNTIDKDLSDSLLAQLDKISGLYPKPPEVAPKKSDSFLSFFHKEKGVVEKPKQTMSAPAKIETPAKKK